MCVEGSEVWENFTFLGSVMHNTSSSCQEVFHQTGLAYIVMDLLNTSIQCVSTCAEDKDLDHQAAGAPSLWHGCET